MRCFMGRCLWILFLFLSFSVFASHKVDKDPFEPNETLHEVADDEKAHKVTVKEVNSGESHRRQWLVGIGGGVDAFSFFDRVSNLVNNSLNPTSLDTFTESNQSSLEAIFLIKIGYRNYFQYLKKKYFYTLSLEYDDFTNSNRNGQRTYFINISSNYIYKVKRQSLLFVAKLDVFTFKKILTYLEAGMGVSRLTFADFQNPINPTVPNPMTPFPNKSTNQFSCIFGLGVDYPFAKRWILSVGYRFAYWGDLQSGSIDTAPATPPFTPQPLPAPIHLEHAVFSNEGVLTLSYLIG